MNKNIAFFFLVPRYRLGCVQRKRIMRWISKEASLQEIYLLMKVPWVESIIDFHWIVCQHGGWLLVLHSFMHERWFHRKKPGQDGRTHIFQIVAPIRGWGLRKKLFRLSDWYFFHDCKVEPKRNLGEGSWGPGARNRSIKQLWDQCVMWNGKLDLCCGDLIVS